MRGLWEKNVLRASPKLGKAKLNMYISEYSLFFSLDELMENCNQINRSSLSSSSFAVTKRNPQTHVYYLPPENIFPEAADER